VILVLDNYDSFTWNLVQYLGELGAEPEVRRNDALTVDEALDLGAVGIVISPGPGEPARAGIAVALVQAAAVRRVPVLGVCLGHQAIGEAFGGRVVRAERPMHGKTDPVRHRGEGVLAGLPDPLTVMRYHSLVVERASLPATLEVTASSPAGEVMALRHRTAPIEGVQFHPESIGTDGGRSILANFFASLRAFRP
jgi:anthranilate synthase component 2